MLGEVKQLWLPRSLRQPSIRVRQLSSSGYKYIFHVLSCRQWREARGRVVSTWQLQRWQKPGHSSYYPLCHTGRAACSRTGFHTKHSDTRCMAKEAHQQPEEMCPTTPGRNGHGAGNTFHLKSLHGIIARTDGLSTTRFRRGQDFFSPSQITCANYF